VAAQVIADFRFEGVLVMDSHLRHNSTRRFDTWDGTNLVQSAHLVV
jgi:hypothetical protein